MTEVEEKRRRVTVKYVCPNPLFEKWISEWRDEAKRKGSKMKFCFENALQSLKKYPLPLESGRDCCILQGFGQTLCEMLERKLSKHKLEKCIKGPDEAEVAKVDPPKKVRRKLPGQANLAKATKKSPKKANMNDPESTPSNSQLPASQIKDYKPKPGTGAHSLIWALFNDFASNDNEEGLSKADLMFKAQPFCNSSFTKPQKAGSFYTAWSSMSILISKGIVTKKGSPPKFALTESGLDLACKLSLERGEASESSDKLSGSKENCDEREKPFLTGTEIGAPVESKRDRRTSSSDDDDIQIIDYKLTECSSNEDKKAKTFKETRPKAKNKKAVIMPSTSAPTSVSNSASTSTLSSAVPSSQDANVFFSPYSFDVLLLVDKKEISGKLKNASSDETVSELVKLGIPFELRDLKLGDFAWICRERSSRQEMILPYIVERKRIDDLCKSIKDGRFHEQKFRLKTSGLQNPIYLVESYASRMSPSLPMASLQQAVINTAVQDNFSIKYSDSKSHSMLYLSNMTELLVSMFKGKTIVSCSKEELGSFNINDDMVFLMMFQDFNSQAAKVKSLTVKDMFLRHLVQLNGLSVDKALAIVDKYPSPRTLIQAYQLLDAFDGEKMLAPIKYGSAGKKIGPVISQTLYQFYTMKYFPL